MKQKLALITGSILILDSPVRWTPWSDEDSLKYSKSFHLIFLALALAIVVEKLLIDRVLYLRMRIDG